VVGLADIYGLEMARNTAVLRIESAIAKRGNAVMNRHATRLAYWSVILAAFLWTPQARAFNPCSPTVALLLGKICITGHYQITNMGAAGLGFSRNALLRVADANANVDYSEMSYALSAAHWEMEPDPATYDATHHFDHYPGLPHPPGNSEDQQAFINARSYVLKQRDKIITILKSGDCSRLGEALDDLGQALHAVQDLYSHSNYVDSIRPPNVGLDGDKQNQLNAALLDSSIAPPAALKLTLYNFAADPENPTSECNPDNPSIYCHEYWSKDYPEKNPISGSVDHNTSAFTAASKAAQDATARFIMSIITAVGSATWNNLVGTYGTTSSPCLPPPPQPPCSIVPTGCHPQNFMGSTITSGDPNNKAGSQGFGSQQYISGATPLRYAIQYGNETTASAPAAKVVISDPIDIVHADLNTFGAGPILFGNQLIIPPAIPGDYSTTVDLRPANNLLVSIQIHLDRNTGILTYTFQSLDPATNLPPSDPTAGFLPPGATGSVFFTVMAKAGVTTDTAIMNQATVVFDALTPIPTPTWSNTIDNTAPVSHALGLPADESSVSLTIAWSGADVGSGIQNYTIYVSDNGGAYTAWLTGTTATSATYTGQIGHTYSFYSIATDNVGNVEPPKTAAEATTQVTAAVAQVTPTVTVTPSSRSTATTQALTVTVSVTGGTGNPIPTGSVALASGSYTSAPVTLVGGAATISIPAGSLAIGTDALLVTYTPDTASSTTYNSASGSASISVQGYPVITWDTPATITYGTPLSAAQLDATASVAGSFAYLPPSGTMLNAGSQTLTVNFNPSDTTDYRPISSSVTLLVNQASQTIAFTGLPAAATYGAAGPYTLNSTGGASGNAVTYAVTGPASIAGSILTIIGAGTVTVTASQAGNTNYMAATPVSQTILVSKASSTTVLGAASTTLPQGTADLLKVTVTGAGQQPSGTVQFIAGTTALCTSTLSVGVATCSYVPSASGSVLVLAQYQGDTNHLGSSASLTLTVYDTAITLKVRRAELFYSERLEGEVCVTSAIRARATGTVEILDGTTLLTTRELHRDGCAHWEDRSELSVGTHVLTAVYSGDNKNPAGISAPVTVTVSPVRVDLDVFCGDDRLPYGRNYDCKVSVHSHAGPAEGSISYSLDGESAVTLPLSNGNAEFTITRPAVGSHTVVVDYAQQTNYAAAGPITRDFTVTLAPVNVNLTMTPSRRTVEAGTSVTFQANVTSWSVGPPNATGSVSFYDGSNLLATVPVNPSGKADYATASLTIGYHTITATYSGSANYAPGSSSVTIMITH
jgi:hypothetical protein